MFFDDDVENMPKTSSERYTKRVENFVEWEREHPKFKHWTFWVAHNCIAHPLLGLFPGYKTAQLHNLTSNWLNRKHTRFLGETNLPSKFPNKFMWVWHNTVVHVLIGLVPCKWTFAYHDRTAEKLGVPGWV